MSLTARLMTAAPPGAIILGGVSREREERNVEQLSTYELIQKQEIEELNSLGYLFEHKKSGAQVLVLTNDDENKVFNIGFRTPPKDDTGVAHILEHSVLCGSNKFPLKDPFNELAKGSLNTFLNAMTFSDKTLYPVASCNPKDFRNLIEVYMDAVFFPNIYKEEKIFRQEGWNYFLESPEKELKYNGVVYNEMKGAFSSPNDVLDRAIENSLFPDTCYGCESGGDPEKIPELSYEEFLEFHRKYYHPSNSFIYLYGDMNAKEILEWMDREYLHQYNRQDVDSEIDLQPAFPELKKLEIEYPVSENESEENNTYLTYNVVVDTGLNKNLYYAFQVLDYALLNMPGAPLKKALIDAGIGQDIIGGYEYGILQPYFSVVAKKANAKDEDKFIEVIQATLKKAIQNGLDKNSLKAGLNMIEFKFREADYGYYPKGLMYSLKIFHSWLYDKKQPFLHVRAYETFEWLKQQIETDYFETLIQTYLLENTHATILKAIPKRGLTSKKDQALERKLQEKKNRLSEKELEQMADNTKALLLYQAEPSTEEELKKIPLLKIEDIKTEPEPFYNQEKEINGVRILHHEISSNGIAYFNLTFQADALPLELVPYIGLLKYVLGYMDTQNYTYGELANEINLKSGGVLFGLGVYENSEIPGEFVLTVNAKAKVLYQNIDFACRILEEIYFHTKWEDKKRLLEILQEILSRLETNMMSGGSWVAVQRALSYYSEMEYIKEITNGIAFYRFVKSLTENFEQKAEDVIEKMQEVLKKVLQKPKMILSFTADKEGYTKLEQHLALFTDSLYSKNEEAIARNYPLEVKNEGFLSSSQVQYVARVGNFKSQGYDYHGSMKVLKTILSYEYLWNQLRVQGGAYDFIAALSRDGDCYFVSYRDPNLLRTNEVYNKMPQYIREFESTDREMVKFIIGTIGEMDAPLTPATKGFRSFTAYMTNLSYETLKKERRQVLETTVEDIRKQADAIESVLAQKILCVIGNERKVKEEEQLFGQLENLFE